MADLVKVMLVTVVKGLTPAFSTLTGTVSKIDLVFFKNEKIFNQSDELDKITHA